MLCFYAVHKLGCSSLCVHKKRVCYTGLSGAGIPFDGAQDVASTTLRSDQDAPVALMQAGYAEFL